MAKNERLKRPRLARRVSKNKQEKWDLKFYRAYRNNSATHMRELPDDDAFRDWFTKTRHKNCTYCNSLPPVFLFEGVLVNKGNGIDRVNNALTYLKPNMVPCCEICNYMKRELSLSEFKEWVAKVYNRLHLKKVLHAFQPHDVAEAEAYAAKKFRMKKLKQSEVNARLRYPLDEAKAAILAKKNAGIKARPGDWYGNNEVIAEIGYHLVGTGFSEQPAWQPKPKQAKQGTRQYDANGKPRKQTADMLWVRCKCGKEKAYRRTWIEGGRSLCCGVSNCHLPQKDGIGLQLGMLEAVEDLGIPDDNNGMRMYRCLCHYDGEYTVMRANDFMTQKLISCGCIMKMPNGVSVLNAAFSRLNHDAKHKKSIAHLPPNKRCTLTRNQYMTVAVQDCQWCGDAPSLRTWRGCGTKEHNGLDRIVNNRGYDADNVWAACAHCNRARNELTVEEFEEAIRRTYEFMHRDDWSLPAGIQE